MSEVKYECMKNPAVARKFLGSLSEDFISFTKDAFLTSEALDEFLKFLANNKSCENINRVEFDEDGSVLVTFDHYPEDYLKASLKLLFQKLQDGTYNLVGFTRKAIDQDPTAMQEKEFVETGVSFENRFNYHGFYQTCAFVLNNAKIQTVHFYAE
jgi:hypothetical protein